MSKLLETQQKFTLAVARLILHAKSLGYETTFGDCYRDERCAYGAKDSDHKKRLAVDLNLFVGGEWIKTHTHHKILSDFWLSDNPENAYWGGVFDDPNHYGFKVKK